MIRDEDLTAFLDGELDDVSSRRIEAALATDAALRDRMDRLNRADEAVRSAFGAALNEGRTQSMEDAIRAAVAGHAKASPATAEVLPFARPARAAPRWVWPVMMAATLVMGVLVGRTITPITNSGGDWISPAGTGAPAAGPRLASALSRTPSGVAFDLADNRKGQVSLTFASASGDLCRQFEITDAAGRQDALACRSGRADWRLVALTSTARAGPGGAFRTAAGPGEDPVSAMADRLIAGEPMDAAQEAAALR